MKYTPKVPPIIEADFFKDINHIPNTSLDIRRVPVSIQGVCNLCNRPLNLHGFIEQNILCPNTYIVNNKKSLTVSFMDKEIFESIYKPLDMEEGKWKDAKESQRNN